MFGRFLAGFLSPFLKVTPGKQTLPVGQRPLLDSVLNASQIPAGKSGFLSNVLSSSLGPMLFHKSLWVEEKRRKT